MRIASSLAVIWSLLALSGASAAPADLIVFARTGAGFHSLVYSIRPDGSARHRLRASARDETEPLISPNGRLIASVAGGAIVIRSRGGGVIRRIGVSTRSELREPSWGPGGRWLAVLVERCEDTGGRSEGPLCADLWLVRRDGRLRRRLVNANVSTSDVVAQYAWSPDGRSIVLERFDPRSLAIVEVRTGSTSTLAGTRRLGTRDPDWARSGWIVFARQRGPFRGSDLYAVRPSGRSLHRICRAQSAEHPAASDDGALIAFLDFRSTPELNRWFVRVVPVDGGRCRDAGVHCGVDAAVVA